MKIWVEFISDSSDCDTCGSNWAQGAVVKFEDGRQLDMSPMAACYGGTHYDDVSVYQAILEELGHEVIEV